jgi:hypothetical protein
MAAKRDPAWKGKIHEAFLTWGSPIDLDVVANDDADGDHANVLTEDIGMYLWQVPTWAGLSREHLYVGQTKQGFGKRTSAHLKKGLGTKLRALREDGKMPRLFCGALTCATMPKGRGFADFLQPFLDTVERTLIWELKPKWNTQHTVTARLPLHVVIENRGRVPPGVQEVFGSLAGERHRGL